MIVKVKAIYSNATLTPLGPLDLEEGKEVMVSIEEILPEG
jgi:predicted DNA-binding antitoxin AbrB/MazE fold protein